MIHILPAFQLIGAYGLYSFFQVFKYRRVLTLVVFGALIVQMVFFLHIYFFHWPRIYAGDWQYGYKQAVEAIKPLYNDADYIVVSKSLGRPYIYFLLYLQYDPQKFQQSAAVDRDRFYFIDVRAFDKFKFVEGPDDADVSGRVIYVMPKGRTPPSARPLGTIVGPNNAEIFEISKQELSQ